MRSCLYVAAAKLILSGIDSLAGFYSGRITSGQISSSFIDFVDKYLPNFNKVTTFRQSNGIQLINRKTGHAYLGHPNLPADQKAEKEADDFAESFGFKRCYKKYKIKE